ncbi:MAG: hypothetical protein ACOWWM_01165 [Desulfobacterales bacterium]
MKALLIFLGQAIECGISGRHISRGLGGIDPRIPEMLQNQCPFEEIEAYLKSKDLDGSVTRFAVEAMQSSFVLPFFGKDIPTSSRRTELVRDVLETAFNAAARLQMDLLLPGSVVSPNTYSIFIRNESAPNLSLQNGKVMIEPREHSIFNNRLYIIPAPDRHSLNATWKRYKEAVAILRNEDPNYLSVRYHFKFLAPMFEDWHVENLTAGSCRFKHSVTMNERTRAFFSIQDGAAPYQDCYGGMNAMLDGLKEIVNALVLDAEEAREIDALDSKRSQVGLDGRSVSA